jgi:CheY-like chemotaxis protein
MQSHQGDVMVRSELGRGTTFDLYFPAAEALAEPIGKTPAPRQLGRGKHILYVDDEEALVFLASRLLPRSGYRVTGHSDSLQALSDFRSRASEFDAVVTDISMPGLSGPELVRELWQTRPDLPVVMTSGYIRSEDVECARRLGVGDLILKPDTIDELTEVLHRRLAAVTRPD